MRKWEAGLDAQDNIELRTSEHPCSASFFNEKRISDRSLRADCERNEGPRQKK